MRVSEFGRQKVSPRDFWAAVVAVTFLLGAGGACVLQAGRVPGVPSWLQAGFLLLLWGVALFRFLRGGRRAFQTWQVALLLGYTLLAGSHLLPRLGRGGDGVGTILVMGGLLWPYLAFGKRPPPTSPAEAPAHPDFPPPSSHGFLSGKP